MPTATVAVGGRWNGASFTVVDDKSEEKPEIEITGEAFSAYGLRKGNLISCRARVELKAHLKTNGKLVAADRQTPCCGLLRFWKSIGTLSRCLRPRRTARVQPGAAWVWMCWRPRQWRWGAITGV